MYVRLNIGRYAGEIRDVVSEAARQMLADGRASDPFALPPEPAVLAASESVPVATPVAAPATRKKRSPAWPSS